MPILRGSVTFCRFTVELTVEPPRDQRQWLSRGLKAHPFEPIDRSSEDERAAGFVELERHDAAEFAPGSLFYGEYALFGWRVDQIKIPAATVREELEKWAAAFEKDNARKPRRGEKNDARAAIRQTLRGKAIPSSKVFDVSWSLKAGQVQLWVTSRKVVEEIQQALEKGFSMRLLPRVPSVVAEKLGIPEEDLKPTPALCMPEGAGEVTHGTP